VPITSPSSTIPVPTTTPVPPPSTTVPAPAPPPVSRAELRLGAKGSDVVALQQRLTVLGFSPGNADGDYGPTTRNAVLAFQRSKGLGADAVVGPRTWAALNSLQ